MTTAHHDLNHRPGLPENHPQHVEQVLAKMQEENRRKTRREMLVALLIWLFFVAGCWVMIWLIEGQFPQWIK